ncbi:TRAP transporter small permease [Pseudooceanicola sp. HF7]|uniref:TRAP transporter small permease n=1 Tax=Pseudooceanicola sp. HF7 TaxID=2721560 RepID=UPI001431A93D|nr:TRAP transporter small permease subunit [Pseudooceanicola sp. HF7]NIZ10703.1 TRAP transporter small permease subunit [Pseudooceanicola sp. HF7]
MRPHAFFLFLSRAMAVLGGLVLSALVLLIVVSVAGRAMNTFLHSGIAESLFPGLAQNLLDAGIGPIVGDFELVEAGIAFTIFSFLPLTQITGSHAVVDIFTSAIPRAANRFLIALWEVVFAVVMVIIAWRLYEGMLNKMQYNETTFLLQFPVWWAYAASLVAAVVAAIVTIYVAAARVAELVLARAILPVGEGAGH